MPLSKKRDRERKKVERAKLRLDRLLVVPQGGSGVQPKPTSKTLNIEKLREVTVGDLVGHDADGYPFDYAQDKPIYEE